MKKKNTLKTVLGISILILIAAGIGLGVFINHRSKLAHAIPEGTLGNTSGNINNRGRFCECDGYVYFANPYDDQKLYRMRSDGSEPVRLSEISAEFINAYGDEIFFYQTSGVGEQVFGLGSQFGVCRYVNKGSKGTSFIDKAACNSLILYGPYIYYQRYDADEGLRLYKASTIDNSKKEISEKEVFVSCPSGGKFYCCNTDNMYYMSTYNEATDEMELAPGNVRAYNITLDNGYIYFMNIDDSYKIYRMALTSGGEIEKLVDEKVDIFNVYGNNLFYQKSSEQSPALIYVNLSTGDETVVAEGNYTNINCTSEYTYFYPFGNDSKVYRVPTSGGNASDFRPM